MTQLPDALMLGALRSTLERVGHLHVSVRGMSMWPLVWPGCRVLVEACRLEQVVAGELVLYERAGRPVLHRAVGRRGDRLLVRADRREDIEPPLTEAELLGRVRGLAVARSTWEGAPRLVVAAAGRLSSVTLPWLWTTSG